MAYVLAASCGECGYRSGDLRIGNRRNFVVTCRACRKLVNPETIPFRLDMPSCPLCSGALGEADVVDFRVRDLERVACPACGVTPIAFETLVHMSIEVRDRRPDEGSLVHAFYSEGRCPGHPELTLASPGYPAQKLELLPTEQEIDMTQPFECEVLGAGGRVYLRCVRQINWNDFG